MFVRRLVLVQALATVAVAKPFAIDTPYGSFTIDVPHVAPSGSLVKAPEIENPEFRPPSIFSAPLPSGSGARALGLGGAFTAIADDATAASWNPGGLLQLEAPEVSFVLRGYRESQTHHSSDRDFGVGDDDMSGFGLNYLSLVYPFQLADRNFVCSLNLQEAYDYNQQFHANLSGTESARDRGSRTESFRETRTERATGGDSYVDVTTHLTSRKTTTFNQALDSSLLSELDFEQEGVVYATTPALAAEVTRRLAVGLAVNIHHDSPFDGQSVRSTTRARYGGVSDGRTRFADTVTTSGYAEYEGLSISLPDGDVPFGETNVIDPGRIDIQPFSDRADSSARAGTRVEGLYEEENRFDDFSGIGLTLGGLWSATERVTLGASVDLPFTADATQKKTIRTRSTTYSSAGSVLDETDTTEQFVKDVEFEFPLRASAGTAVRWGDALTTAFDAEYTRWSDFTFKAAGAGRVNPLDGTPHGEHEIADCWTLRLGAEYLWILGQTEIPLRAGVARVERPALGSPDELWQLSLGTGASLGRGPGRVIIDVAYQYTQGDDVLESLVPGRNITTDVEEHEVYVSCIRHF